MFNIGQEVFYQEFWSRSIIKAKIVSFNEDKTAANIQDICHPMLPEDDVCYRAIGSRTYPVDQLYDSLDAIRDALNKEWKHNINVYKEQIKTVEDLINFPLNHCFNGEEYTDEEAMCAYKERAKELGFNITE